MRAYIACLAAYNSGRLHGQWFDVSTDADENQDNINAVLASSPIKGAEEYAVHDYEAPKALADTLGDYPGAQALADAARLEEAIAERFDDADERDAVLSQMLDGQSTRDLGSLADDADEWLSDHIAGEASTLTDWCSEFLEETDFFGDAFRDKNSEQASTIERYFDFESYARDLQLGGDISTARANGKLLVFWNH